MDVREGLVPARAFTGARQSATVTQRMRGLSRRTPWRMLLLFVLAMFGPGWAACPSSCSYHGTCNASNVCVCEEGWDFAPDCSLRTYADHAN